MTTLSTHVLDTAMGRPAEGVHIALEREGIVIDSGVTDADGRVRDFSSVAPLSRGRYRLVFSVAAYFAATGRESFYSEIVVSFQISEAAQHYHVPLLLSPFGYSTYRGS